MGSIGLVKVEICLLFVTWPRCRSVTWLCGWNSLILSHHPAKFGIHRPYGTGNNDVCKISSNSNSVSNSNSNAAVSMPRFTNGFVGLAHLRVFIWKIFISVGSWQNQVICHLVGLARLIKASSLPYKQPLILVTSKKSSNKFTCL